MSRTINEAGRNLIKSFEKCRLEAYLDDHTPPIPTIGWGHTGPEVHLEQRISQLEADGLLEQDLAAAERAVEHAAVAPLTDNQFSAIVAAYFNVGPKLFRNADGSPTTIFHLLSVGDRLGAAKELTRWDHSGGRELAGLLRRRFTEASLFLTP
jgi:lysozyme